MSSLSILFMRFRPSGRGLTIMLYPLSIPFNSLYEIQPHILILFTIKNFSIFQFSLWDSCENSSVWFSFRKQYFQFSLWDSLLHFFLILHKLYRLFQFSLWDSWESHRGDWGWRTQLSILFMRFSITLLFLTPIFSRCFQFSLWDSCDPNMLMTWFLAYLSILFMRFYISRRTEILVSMDTSFNSLYEIPVVSAYPLTILHFFHFQFSLWDSWANTFQLGSHHFISTFNSLYEILGNGKEIRKHLQTFNSLYEIQVSSKHSSL